MFLKATENGCYLWLQNYVHSSAKKVETAWLIVFRNTGVADHAGKTSFVIAIIGVAFGHPKETHGRLKTLV